jgi:hypothetical protein
MDNLLAFETGADILFPPLALGIHQPLLKEIAMIGGDKTLYGACSVLLFSKDKVEGQDKKDLEQYTDFDIIMTMINENDPSAITHRINILQLFTLLFPDYKIRVKKDCFELEDSDGVKKELNNQNFGAFREILVKMFHLEDTKEEKYNPGGSLAAELAKKFEQRHKKLAEQKGEKGATHILDRQMSIIQAGMGIDLITLSNYTVYMLYDTFNRYRMKSEADRISSILLAGGKIDDLPDDWMDWMKEIEY